MQYVHLMDLNLKEYLSGENAMPIYELKENDIIPVPETTFTSEGVKERKDLQRLIKKNVNVVLPDSLIISEEFGDWDDSRRRIDLLAIDKDANVVVIELKRTEDGGHMDLQALRYAAMVSNMTFEQAVDTFAKYLEKNTQDGDAQKKLLEFLSWNQPQEDQFAQDVRIVLISSGFSKELTTTVLWLIERGIDIICVRLKPYKLDDRLLFDTQQLIPLPEAADYQVKVQQKEQRERTERKAESRNKELLLRFWTQLLHSARTKTDLHKSISPAKENRIWTLRGGIYYIYVVKGKKAVVEFYIDTGDKNRNEKMFDHFFSQRDIIEQSFGSSLKWERKDSAKSCKIYHIVAENGHLSNEGEWDELHEKMIDAMIRVEKAFAPHMD